MLVKNRENYPQSLTITPRKKKVWLQKLLKPRCWVGIVLFVCTLLCTLGPLRVIFNQDFLIQQLTKSEFGAIFLFLFLFVFLTALGIPGTVLAIAGGVVFGLFWGTIWSVVGATLGAIAAFWLARYLLHDWIKSRFSHHPALQKFEQAIQNQPFTFTLIIRFAPITPFNVVNFLFGLTSIHWFPYSLATLIGIIPGTLLYTWLGVSGMEALSGESRLSFFLALTFLILLSLIPLFAKKNSTREQLHPPH
ncbi:MAG: TVP38/TMEM64 family protein [Oscillatoria sp. PMC 1050.18]|nr:TVP38/TMEM64 family protein [Oscillatoria sp. PMC 1050.18]